MVQPAEARLSLTYGGPALEDGTIAVRDLAPALLAFTELVKHLNRIANGERTTVQVKLRAGPRKGSFEVQLAVVLTWLDHIRDWLAGPDATALSNLLGLLGIGGCLGVLELIRRLRGRRPVAVEPGGESVVVVMQPDERIEVGRAVWQAIETPAVRQAAAAIVLPLEGEGVETLILRDDKGAEVTVVAREDVASFRAAAGEADQVVFEQEQEIELTVIRPVLADREGKWQVSHRGATFWVRMTDEAFLERVGSGAESFAARDTLRCRVKITQRKRGEDLRAEWTVLEVLDHRRGEGQPSLPGMN